MSIAMRVICICLVVAWTALSAGAAETRPPTGDKFKLFENSIVPLPEGGEIKPNLALAEDARNADFTVHFGLEARNAEELQARVSRGEIVSPEEMRERYSGDEEVFNRLVDWLRREGFRIARKSVDFTSVFATAKARTLEKSLGVEMKPVTFRGKTYLAAVTAPRLPLDVGSHVIAIDGLQPFVRAVKHIVSRDKRDAAQNKPPIPRPRAVTAPAYKVQEILRAYDADALGVSGEGEIIAILIDTFPERSDLRAFWKANGLAIAEKQVQYINVRKATLPPPDSEETLDASWASGIAPGATIHIYATGTLQYTHLDQALQQIYEDAQKHPGLRHLSISLGLREDLVSHGEMQIENAIFRKLAAIGVNTFVSSGDSGSNPDRTGHARSPDSKVEYQASDPNTLGVGGTTLVFDRNQGAVSSETAWNDSGGGVSNLIARPSWQSKYSGIDEKYRLVPDVSSVADPSPGAYLIFNGKERPVGGTSWSAPVWAGFSALIAEARRKQGKKPIGFLAPAFYRLGGKGFRDITTGSNGAYKAGPGWDPVTGLGVPKLKELIAELP